MLCKECHMGEGGKLTGRMMSDLPKELGEVASLNITKDPEHGIGQWTDGELYYFLRTGLRKDGSWSPPFMPKFVQMADEDMYSVIAWLRSDDPSLQPDSREYPPNEFNLLVKFLGNVAFAPPPLPEKPVMIPDSTDMVALGRYVANGIADCYSCHSKDFKTNDIVNPEKSPGFYGGGNPMLTQEGEVIHTANITMDMETGIGSWTEQEFLEAVKYGKNPRGGTLHYPMTPRTVLTDTEVRAIFAYLKTVPPIHNAVPRFQSK
jgi:mono/diheme cytochrome c family protein